MRGIADGNDEPVPPTIEDVSILEALRPLPTDSGWARTPAMHLQSN
jgi:hypothetical protein